MMERSAQLDCVIDALSNLVSVLALDPGCQWRQHFENCLRWADELKTDGFDQMSLNELSSSVRSVFGGMGSFNDYAPVKATGAGTFAPISGMKNFQIVADTVYESALNLMVVGTERGNF